jgi:protein O-GlcNAc transferase
MGQDQLPDARTSFQIALEHHQAGRLQEAAALYNQLLDNPDAKQLLGVIAYQIGKSDIAVALIKEAIEINPSVADYYCNLGPAYHALGQLDDAVASYRKALELSPEYSLVYNNLGNVLKDQGKLDEAVASIQKALLFQPNFILAHNNLGNVLKDQGKLAEAIMSYRNALALKPDFVEVHNNLGATYEGLGRLEDALVSYQTALALRPNFPEAHNNIAGVLEALGKSDDAISSLHTALALKPGYVEAFSNLGRVLTAQGRYEEAVHSYRQALAINPDFTKAHNNLLMTMLCASGYSDSKLFAEHVRFGRQVEASLKPVWQVHQNVRHAHKRLKIGYVSPDFRRHPVAYFIESILANHDKSRFEVVCYYNHSQHDHITARLQSYADHWIPCVGMSDDQLAQHIRADGIDILIDLTGHSAGNRLLTFARKPAPVQVTYLGYPGTTGLSAIDYRISDNHIDLPGKTEQFNTEQLWRLPDIISCYRADDHSPAVIEHPPMEENGYVTFGCFNNFTKVTDRVIALWARILDKVPTSRLMLEIHGLDSAEFRSEVEKRFMQLGVPLDRLILISRKKENQYVLYNRIDIALDPFPYNGGTTSFDTLWMGVPFVTLAGTHCVSRLGVSTLTNAGLEELIAQTEDDYAEIAIKLALDPVQLKKIRSGMRERIQQSPLMDAKRFTANMEQAYRAMWQRYCENAA